MKNVYRVGFALWAAMCSAAAAGGLAVGCGDSAPGPGSADDATADVSADGGGDGTTGRPDVTGPDVTGVDVTGLDVTGLDVTLDVTGLDVIGPDAVDRDSSDAGAIADSGLDSDSGAVDAPVGDGSNNSALNAFPGQVAAAVCQQIAACCGVSGDAASFDWAGCVATAILGGPSSILFESNLLDGGHVVFDPAKGQSCLQRIGGIDCTANTLTSAQYTALVADCYAALQGNLGIGSPCNGSVECAPGSFCLRTPDAGPGSCTALRGDGGTCGDFGDPNYDIRNVQSEFACSYRGSGNTGLRCAYASTITGAYYDAATWTCTPQFGVDAGCNAPVDCQTRICDPTTYTCSSATKWIAPAGCPTYVHDAGAGGG